MPCVCEVIRVGGDAVQSRARRSGTSQTLSNGDGLTRKPISDCDVGFVGAVEKVLGLRRRSSVAASRPESCRCVRWLCHVV
jgi:hypothetical protein